MNETNASAIAETVGTLSKVSVAFNEFLIAAFIMLVGFFIGSFAGKVVRKALSLLNLDQFIRRVFKANVPLESFFGFITSSAIYLIAIILALNQIGIASFVFRIISAVLVLLMLISIGLYIRDILPNFLAGINIISTRKIKVGDWVRIDDKTEGDVVRVDLTEICLKTSDGELVYVPPSLIQKSKVEVRKKV